MGFSSTYVGRVSFRRLMTLKETSPDTFESLIPAWPHEARAFGGHVYAQAVCAASKTVASGMTVHNVTGHFLLGGRVDIPFTYRVRRVRDGGAYCLRSVDVFQGSPSPSSQQQVPCFISTISFKRLESNPKFFAYSHQEVPSDHLRKTYQSLLAGKDPSDHELSPYADHLFTSTSQKDRSNREQAAVDFPGVEIRKVDMSDFHRAAGFDDDVQPGKWRQLCFYRIILDDEKQQPDTAVDINLHCAAHMYTSDRNSLFMIQRAHKFENDQTQMGSLAHTVIFHGLTHHSSMVDSEGKPKWFVQEAWTSNSGANRGCHESRLWEWEDGRIIATTVQDGMIRILREPDPKTGVTVKNKLGVKL